MNLEVLELTAQLVALTQAKLEILKALDKQIEETRRKLQEAKHEY